MDKTPYWLQRPEYDTPELRQLIYDHSTPWKLAPGQIFISPGDLVNKVYFIDSGITNHYTLHPMGREKVLYRLGSGWFASSVAFLYTRPVIASRFAVAETETVLQCIGREDFVELMGIREFAFAAFHCASRKSSIVSQEMESLVFDSSKERLHSLLASLADRSSTFDGIWHGLIRDFTHQEMANIVGTNRVTVSKYLTELRDEHIIRTINNRIQINKDRV